MCQRSPRMVALAVAVDGEDPARVRHRAPEPGRHLLAALDHAHGVVLAQVDVEANPNEIPLFTTLLGRIDLTADALHAQRAQAQYLVAERGAHYVLTVKRNQPRLHAQLKALPWRAVRSVMTPATAATAGSNGAPSRSPPWRPDWASRTPPRHPDHPPRTASGRQER